MIKWPNQLVSDIARRRAVILIGSGVSKHSEKAGKRPPTWREFLTKAIEDCPGGAPKHISEALERGDYLHACEWLKLRFDEEWVGYLRETFQAPGYPPSALHEHILALDSRVVFTLNFDDIYERAAHALKAGSHIIKSYHDLDVSEFLRGPGRYIVRVHGSLDSPQNLIFTQADYARARVKNSTFYEAFDAALMTHSFIFIGAGYADPDVNLLLENQMFSFPTSQPHYFVTSVQSNNDLKSSLRKNRNLKVIEYDKKDENHSGLVDEIHELVDQVEDARLELVTTNNW